MKELDGQVERGRGGGGRRPRHSRCNFTECFYKIGKEGAGVGEQSKERKRGVRPDDAVGEELEL